MSRRLPQVEQRTMQAFDKDSGLVYTETFSKPGPMQADWVWKTLGSSSEVAHFKSIGPGCSTLKNVAVRSVVVNMDSVNAESLVTVPWSVAKDVWTRLSI